MWVLKYPQKFYSIELTLMKLSGYEPKNGPEMDPKMDQKNLKILAKSKNGPKNLKWTYQEF